MFVPASDGARVPQPGWDLDLSGQVPAPRDHRAVTPQCERMHVTSCDRGDACEISRGVGFTQSVGSAPPDHGSVLQESKDVAVRPTGDADHVRESLGDVVTDVAVLDQALDFR